MTFSKLSVLQSTHHNTEVQIMKDRKVTVSTNIEPTDYEALASRFENVSEAVRKGIAVVVANPRTLADVVANLVEGSKNDD